MSGWHGVDLDGTLAEYHGWKGVDHIGPPVPAMVERVRAWLEAGEGVKVVTARVCGPQDGYSVAAIGAMIRAWTREHVGVPLEVTCSKDFQMIDLWDDRCVQVEPNTGRRVDGLP